MGWFSNFRSDAPPKGEKSPYTIEVHGDAYYPKYKQYYLERRLNGRVDTQEDFMFTVVKPCHSEEQADKVIEDFKQQSYPRIIQK